MIDALRAFGFEELIAAPASPNGYAYHLICHGCLQEFGSNRALAGKRPWCPECRAAGKPGAQRQADLRARRAQNG